MNLDQYQDTAARTDQFDRRKNHPDGLMIPLLGLAGESGTLLSEFKKKIRDKESYAGFKTRAEEEIGDVLWYLANIATRLDLSLSTIAAKNLYKTQERWKSGGAIGAVKFFDHDFLKAEQFPRTLTVKFRRTPGTNRSEMLSIPREEPIGAALTDNAYDDDGYRFHDVIHLAFMAVLGWSPVMRSLLKRKRKSRPKVDEVEDGARAAILEELVVAFVYNNARERRFYAGIKHVDTEMLLAIKRIVGHLEVARQPSQLWESAILQGYKAFRHLRRRRGGIVRLDLRRRRLLIVR
jgi:NTP pyrophosphatase (non-canonical NTP hydrolase)